LLGIEYKPEIKHLSAIYSNLEYDPYTKPIALLTLISTIPFHEELPGLLESSLTSANQHASKPEFLGFPQMSRVMPHFELLLLSALKLTSMYQL